MVLEDSGDGDLGAGKGAGDRQRFWRWRRGRRFGVGGASEYHGDVCL